MVLAPTKENLVSEAELTAWMNRNKPAMCHILPQTNVPDPERNNTSFKQLLGLLTERKIVRFVHIFSLPDIVYANPLSTLSSMPLWRGRHLREGRQETHC